MTARALLVMLACATAQPLWAKLPPPTLEEQQAAAQKKAQQQAQEEQQKKALDAAQDRVAERYKRNHPSASAASSGTGSTSGTEERNALPKTTRELPGQAGPQGGREPSAEAHSAPAK